MNIVIDIETTGLNPGCCVLSLAAVPITKDIKPFSINIAHQNSLDAGFTDDPETIAWWNQPEMGEAHIRTWTCGGDLRLGLELFNDYLHRFDNVHLWSLGKDFDFPILRYTYSKLGLKFPVSHRNFHCLRDLMQYTGVNVFPTIEGCIHHTAIGDATVEAAILENILQGNKAEMSTIKLPE